MKTKKPYIRPKAMKLLNQVMEALSGEAEIQALNERLLANRISAARIRCILKNGGYGPNTSQLRRVDEMLAQIQHP